MFVVTVDIWPHGLYDYPDRRLTIAAYNEGNGTPRTASYSAHVVPNEIAETGNRAIFDFIRDRAPDARVRDFPRGYDQAHLPSLVSQIIDNLGLGEYVRKE